MAESNWTKRTDFFPVPGQTGYRYRERRDTLISETGEILYVVGGSGPELDELRLDQAGARELRVLLMNPYCEQLKSHLYRISRHPRAAAEQLHLQLLLTLAALKRWAQDAGFALRLRVYDDLPSSKLRQLDETSAVPGEGVWCPAFFGRPSKQVESVWDDPTNAEYCFEKHQLVQHDSTGRLMRRIDVSQPPRLPYFDDDGGLVVSI